MHTCANRAGEMSVAGNKGKGSRVSIKDVARAAGVSHSTVSRALRNSPLVNAETAAHIRRIAEEMGYIPNIVAQSLVTQRTYTVGLVVTTISDPFIDQIVEGIEDLATREGYSVFLSSSHADPGREIAVVEAFHRRRVDGVIVLASRVGSMYTERLQELGVPIVLINNQADGAYLYSVSADDLSGARQAVRHLVDLGHTCIGYVGCHFRPPSNRRRLEGYRQELARAGLPYESDLVVHPKTFSDVENGRLALDALLNAGATAAFCYNDRMAIGLMAEARHRGIRVPEDLSIVGFDDIEASSYVFPSLTTVKQPRFEMGMRAMQMLLDLLAGQEVDDDLMPCELVVRESTAPPRKESLWQTCAK